MKKMKSAFIQDTSLLLQAFEEEGFNNLQNISLSRVLEKFENILNEEDLVDATQMETIVKLLIESDIVSPNTDDMKLYNKLVKELKSKLTYWRKSLQVNDCFDSYHETDHKWYRVKILQKLSGNIFYIHYNGWPDKYNTEIDVSQENACYPCNYRVQLKKIKKESLPSDIPSIDDSIKVELEDTSIIIQPETAGNISGNNELTRLRADMNYKEHSKCVKREKKNVSYGEDSNDWICAICIDFETTIDEDELVLCDGVCKRSFHASCLKSKNMKLTNKEGNTEEWFCKNCITEKHECFLCKEVGKDNIEVFKCSVHSCSKFYHHSCLGNSEYRIPILNQTENKVTIKCPYHCCDICDEFYSHAKEPLFSCLLCPKAFHVNCIPPGSRFNPDCLICTEHPDHYLPNKLVPSNKNNDSFAWLWDQMAIPTEPPDVNDLLGYHFRLTTSMREEVNNQPVDFKLLKRLEYESLPNKRKSLPQYALDENDRCSCQDYCDENCINRILNVECCEFQVSSSNIRSNCNVFNNLSIPQKHFDCGNRKLQYCQYIQTEKFKEFNRGYGLRSLQDVSEGDLVIEYIGEVIDEENMIQRMRDQRKFNPTDHDFYVMQLDSGAGGVFYVDGKKKGNYSRYINHSCDPNCELQRWNVNGTMRIAIVAIRDIEANEALSYDYQFDTKEDNIFKCYCESYNCRGTMAPKKKNHQQSTYLSLMKEKLMISTNTNGNGNGNGIGNCIGNGNGNGIGNTTSLGDLIPNNEALNQLSQNERRKLVFLLQKNLKDKLKLTKSLQKKMKSQKGRSKLKVQVIRSYVSKMLPGDVINEIRNGPLVNTFTQARAARLFLVRNMKNTTNFLVRKRRYACRHDYLWKKLLYSDPEYCQPVSSSSSKDL